MPTNLTAEQIRALQQYYAPANSGYVNPSLMNIDGMAYQPYDQFGQSGSEGGHGASNATGGYIVYDQNATKPGDKFTNYGADGSFSNDGQFKDMSGVDPLLLAFLAAAGGMAFGLPGLMGAEAATGAGVSGAAFGDAGLMYGGADAAAAGLAGGGGSLSTVAPLAGAGGIGAGAGGISGAAFGDAGLMYGGADAAAAGSLGGGASLSTVAPLAAGAGSGLSGLLGASKWLGPAATLLGGLAGSQGTDKSETQVKKMDPRLDPYVFGSGGLLDYASQKFKQGMSPEQMADIERMRSVGNGLLGTQMRGNGFSKFFPGR